MTACADTSSISKQNAPHHSVMQFIEHKPVLVNTYRYYVFVGRMTRTHENEEETKKKTQPTRSIENMKDCTLSSLTNNKKTFNKTDSRFFHRVSSNEIWAPGTNTHAHCVISTEQMRQKTREKATRTATTKTVRFALEFTFDRYTEAKIRSRKRYHDVDWATKPSVLVWLWLWQ